MMLRDTRRIELTTPISLSEMVCGGPRGPKDPARHPRCDNPWLRHIQSMRNWKGEIELLQTPWKVSNCAIIVSSNTQAKDEATSKSGNGGLLDPGSLFLVVLGKRRRHIRNCSRTSERRVRFFPEIFLFPLPSLCEAIMR